MNTSRGRWKERARSGVIRGEVQMTAMPKPTGLFEAHLTVSDLDRSIEFYREVVGLPLALEVPVRPERGIVAWSEWTTLDPHGQAVHVEPFSGPHSELRALFEEAEDSAQELDAYIDDGAVLVATTSRGVVGHLQLIDAAAD